MSLPPLNPDRSTSGIIVDPNTLERVVPQSRRKDGTTRKELKIRPGFTPQEDVGRFRSVRQSVQDAVKGTVPGSNRPPADKAADPDNPFAQPVASAPKSKAQLKNEKRREKKRQESANKAWDESDDDDEDGGNLQDDFNDADRKRGEAAGSEAAFAGLGPRGGAPENPSPLTAELDTATPEGGSEQDTTAILSPPGGKADVPETASELPSAPKAKPPRHPIQGGRQGPIGLAHPPPLSSPSVEPPVRSDSPDWRKDKMPPTEGRQRQQPKKRINTPQQTKSKTTEKKPEPKAVKAETKPEPRVRKEVKVRQGGATDVSSLASRVRNLVLDNQASPRERKVKQDAGPASGAAGSEAQAGTTA